jgi:starch-binding outer membrane protein, SusD/RagB family
MKATKYLTVILLSVFLFISCKKYLDRSPDSPVSETDIFGTYESFQGYLDPNYAEIVDYNQWYLTTTMDYGGDVFSYISWSSGWLGNNGDYATIAGDPPNNISLYCNSSGTKIQGPYFTSGIFTGGWRGIRVCNIALRKMNLLTDATDEERKLILGQIYFFRAFFHQGIIEAFGGMPFVDTVFNGTNVINIPRFTYQQVTDRIITDYDKAIALLPDNWDNTVAGAAHAAGTNTGRATKGAAMAYKVKALLYAASPLMNKFSGGDYAYNIDLCKWAATAAWDFIKFNNSSNTYSLVPFSNYSDQYTKLDGTLPWTTETIFQRYEKRSGSGVFYSYMGRQTGGPGRFGGSENCESVNQAFIDKFEMADGTRYKAEYDNDNTKRWENRDPRFRKNIIIDREKHGNSSLTILNLYEGAGTDKTVQGEVALPYLIKKYWLKGVNVYDKLWTNLRTIVPRMRLAEVYLDYAEAVTAAFGPNGSAPGSTLTAVDAINIVRARAGMPPVTVASVAAAGYASFMDFVRNERNVELCFEGHYWFDIRRWHIAHLQENKDIIDMHFDKNWTNFTRSVFFTRIFEDPKHYWLPLPRSMMQVSPQTYQNPGWE